MSLNIRLLSDYREHMKTVHFNANETCQNCGKILRFRSINRHIKNCVKMTNNVPSVHNPNNNCDIDMDEATNNLVINGTVTSSEF